MNDDLLTAGEAAEYLAKRWGRESYSVDAFKQLRHRWGLKPAMHIQNATLWRRSDLDNIPEPSRNNPRPKARHKRKRDALDDPIDNAEYSMVS